MWLAVLGEGCRGVLDLNKSGRFFRLRPNRRGHDRCAMLNTMYSSSI